MAIDADLDGNGGDAAEDGWLGEDLGQQETGGGNSIPLLAFGFFPPSKKSRGVGLVGGAAHHHFDPFLDGAQAGDVDAEAEPVEQLGAELAFLGVHGAEEDEPGGVLEGDPVALDGVDAHRGRIEQQVDEVVRKEIDLVNVKNAAVGGGEQPGLKAPFAFLERGADVECAGEAIFGRVVRQLDDRNRAGNDWQ
ncbi:MAG: hypothetical protein KatS3mg060_0354 [Dehalococcoidia bacterium]|nr:MAG: hypothetical protein KatS3mg060_0354 [Dehalococcoidia bacterium]